MTDKRQLRRALASRARGIGRLAQEIQVGNHRDAADCADRETKEGSSA